MKSRFGLSVPERFRVRRRGRKNFIRGKCVRHPEFENK
jgi:hypothetical protein